MNDQNQKLNRFTALIAGAFLLAGVTGCKPMIQVNKAGYVLGPSNEIKVLDEDKVDRPTLNYLKSSVLISTLLLSKKRKFCSGSLVQTGEGVDSYRILTNFHCFAATSSSGQVMSEFLPEACTNTKIYFNFTANQHQDAIELSCKDGSLIGDPSGDIALFEVNEGFPSWTEPLMFWLEKDIPENRTALIIHHPDVEENFTSVGSTGVQLPAASITNEDCRTLGDFPSDEWPLDQSLPFSVKHSCDLIHGSSGSALIDKETGKILGVNWGGIEIKYKNDKETVNAATKSYYVRAFLDGQFESIKQDSERLAREAELRRKKEQAEQKNGTNIEKAAETLGCGRITAGSGAPLQSLYWILFILLIPTLASLGALCRKTR